MKRVLEEHELKRVVAFTVIESDLIGDMFFISLDDNDGTTIIVGHDPFENAVTVQVIENGGSKRTVAVLGESELIQERRVHNVTKTASVS